MKADLESIAVFVSVVKERTFSAAARELGLSPSAVSKRIAGLEDRFGVSLLNRTTRRVALTDAGREFFERCSQSLSEIVEAQEALSLHRSSPHGTLCIKAPQAFGRLHVAPSIPGFMAQYPQIRIDLVSGSQRRELMDERFDVLIASADPPDQDLVVQRLAPIERVTCAAPSYLERAGRPCEISNLSQHNCLIFTGSDSVENEWVLHGENDVRKVRVAGNFRTNDAEAMYLAVLAGVGVAHMPTFIVGPALNSGELTPIFRDRTGSSGASMKAYFPQAKNRLPKVRAFVDYLTDVFSRKEWLK